LCEEVDYAGDFFGCWGEGDVRCDELWREREREREDGPGFSILEGGGRNWDGMGFWERMGRLLGIAVAKLWRSLACETALS
jgi:hypothetical protein